jgi:HlyD family secretion protein
MKRKLQTCILLAVCGVLLHSCRGGEKQNYLGSGTLEADEIIVSTLVPGTVSSLEVKEGQFVDQGALIAMMDTSRLAAQLRQTRAGLLEIEAGRRMAYSAIAQAKEQYDNVKLNLERQKKLLESGSSTQQIVDDLSTQAATAALRLRAAEDQLSALDAKEAQLNASLDLLNLQIRDAQIRAPVSGTVLEKYVEAGENLLLNGSVVKLADLKHLWIKIYMGEADLGMVTPGTAVTVRVDALPDEPFQGRVGWVSPKAEFTPKNVQTRRARSDLVFAVKVEFENPEGKAVIGMPADVYLK